MICTNRGTTFFILKKILIEKISKNEEMRRPAYKKGYGHNEIQLAIDSLMKDHVTSLHLTTDVFKISINNASALFHSRKRD